MHVQLRLVRIARIQKFQMKKRVQLLTILFQIVKSVKSQCLSDG